MALEAPGTLDALTDLGRRLDLEGFHQLFVVDAGHLDKKEVDAVQEGPEMRAWYFTMAALPHEYALRGRRRSRTCNHLVAIHNHPEALIVRPLVLSFSASRYGLPTTFGQFIKKAPLRRGKAGH